MSQLGEKWRRFQGDILYAYTSLVSRTARWEFQGLANLTKAKASERPVMWCIWHGQGWLLITYGARYEDGSNYTAVVVGDERGDTLGNLASRLGVQTHRVDMQGNPVAAGRAVARVIREMNQGKHSLLFPDGPDGPAFVPKRGILTIARKADALILPVGMWTRHGYQLQRWDHYMVPFPFASIKMVIDQPITANDISDDDELLEETRSALHDARTQAQLAAGITPWQ